MSAPVTSEDFDKVYDRLFTAWGDIRIPKEVKELSQTMQCGNVLELGCGIGRFSHYMALQGHQVTGIDFSPVAISKARKRLSRNLPNMEFHVADVTALDFPEEFFDISFDIGCFHCLNREQQYMYVASLATILKKGAFHLLWTMKSSPNGLYSNPEHIEAIFDTHFTLTEVKKSLRRMTPSYWYLLKKHF